MSQQAEALRRSDGRVNFAYFCQQGTGKSWMVLADAEREYGRGKIDGLVVVAPKGVDTNWHKVEIPTHLQAPHLVALYRQTAPSRKAVEALFTPRADGEMPPLRILLLNYEALGTEKGYALVKRFLTTVRCMMHLDESRRIKNPKALRTKRALSLRHLAVMRRIGTGTPVAVAPVDVFEQMEFLESGLLGTTSHRAFVAEYAELLDEHSPLMRHIAARIGPRARYSLPQVVAHDAFGMPRWKNLDKLHKLLAPHSYRVLKSECLDLPPKIYKKRYFPLSTVMRAVYDKMKSEMRLELDENRVLTATQLALVLKLQQITSGFVHVDQGEPHRFLDADSRAQALREAVEDLPEGSSFIVYARFREELKVIVKTLTDMKINCVEYHGGTKDEERTANVAAFQARQARAFVAQPRSGGIGLTLTAAETVIFYSNSRDWEEREQAEDRAHRKGTRGNVVYIDLIAEDTVDEDALRDFRRKAVMAGAVLGDFSFSRDSGTIATKSEN